MQAEKPQEQSTQFSQVVTSSPPKQITVPVSPAQNQQDLQILAQLQQAVKARSSELSFRPNAQTIVQTSANLDEVVTRLNEGEKKGEITKEDKVAVATLYVTVAQEKFGADQSTRLLTPFFQQLGISQLLMDIIFKTVSENLKKGNYDIQAITQQIMQAYQEASSEKQKELGEQMTEGPKERIERELADKVLPGNPKDSDAMV